MIYVFFSIFVFGIICICFSIFLQVRKINKRISMVEDSNYKMYETFLLFNKWQKDMDKFVLSVQEYIQVLNQFLLETEKQTTDEIKKDTKTIKGNKSNKGNTGSLN